jgi:hypothetical protein
MPIQEIQDIYFYIEFPLWKYFKPISAFRERHICITQMILANMPVYRVVMLLSRFIWFSVWFSEMGQRDSDELPRSVSDSVEQSPS